MIKFIQPLKFVVGDKTATFTGREPQPVEDDVKKALLPIGVFTENADGELFYSGNVEVPMADGTTRKTDARGFIACAMTDLKDPQHAGFR